MSKTPSKELTNTNHFTSKELSTPSKDTNGIKKTTFTHISTIHSLLQNWIRLQNSGNRICRSITSLKLHEFEDDYFPGEVKVLMNSLLQVADSLTDVLEGIELIDKQMQALAKLHPVDLPVIYTWTAKQIAENINNIYNSLKKELKLKLTILENIAHCRDEHLIEVYASAWELNIYFDVSETSYLFIEVGLTGIT